MHNLEQHNRKDLKCLVTKHAVAMAEMCSFNAFRPLSKDLTAMIMLLILPFSAEMSLWLLLHEDFKGLIHL